MIVVNVRNVEEALWQLLRLLKRDGIRMSSRVGTVLVSPTPVTTVYKKPYERVLFSPERDANPFFHLIEALWMLAGRADLATVEYFNRRMREYSDDGITLDGAYGRRWRTWWDKDQLNEVVELLRSHPHSRRAVIQMWDPNTDLHPHEEKKDVCCNICVTVQLARTTNRQLDVTIFCRSNDAIWGAAGANAVHFSILQEYLAKQLDVPMGQMYQISDNLHAYESVLDKLAAHFQSGEHEQVNRYDRFPPRSEKKVIDFIIPDVIVSNGESFDEELLWFFDYLNDMREKGDHPWGRMWKNSFFPIVVKPMVEAYHVFRRGDDMNRYGEMLRILDVKGAPYSDWLRAAREWTLRRQKAFLAKSHEDSTTT